jgi:thiol-disulfide isomerase/thioredoxin
MSGQIKYRIFIMFLFFALTGTFFLGAGYAGSGSLSGTAEEKTVPAPAAGESSVIGQSNSQNAYQIMTASMLDQMLKNEGRNKTVIVSFFASWCPPCRAELPLLVHLRGKMAADELLVLGISLDHSLSDLSRFMKRLRINFPVFLPADEVLANYKVAVIPKTLFFTSKGELFQAVDGAMPEEALYGTLDYLLKSAHE